MSIRFYCDSFDQTDAFLIKIAMQIIGLGQDIVSNQQMHAQLRKIRLTHGFCHMRKGLLCETSLVIPDINIETGACYEIAE